MPTNPMSEVVEHLRRTALPDAAELTDGDLLESFVDRHDEAAFAVLVRRHGPMVWGVCRRALAHHDAEDAFQATFLVLARKAASVRPRQRVADWLYGVARRTARKARAVALRWRARQTPCGTVPEVAVPEPELWTELRPVLDREVSRLPARYRVAVVLCDLEGATRKEAARHLAVPEGTLSGWLSRGRALLARRLGRHGLVVTGTSLAGLLAANAATGAPATVAAAAVKGAGRCLAGPALAGGAVSTEVIALTEGVLKAMVLNKVKVALAVLLVACVVGAGVGAAFFAHPTQAAEPARPRQAADPMGAAPAPPAAGEQPQGGRRRADLQRRLDDLGKQIQALRAELAAARKGPAPAAARPAPAARAEIKIFTLRNAGAEELSGTLQQLFRAELAGSGEDPGKTLRIAAHTSTNSLLVQGSPTQLEAIEAIITRLDDQSVPKKRGNPGN